MTPPTTDRPSESPKRSPFAFASSGYDLPRPLELATLLLRVQLGVAIFWRAGLSKFPLEAWFGDQVAQLGFPAPAFFAWAAAMSEVAGGVLLAIGLCTRPAALVLAATIAVAAFVYHREVPFLNQHITLLYFWGFVFFAAAGAGAWSVDGLLRRRGGAAAVAGLVVLGGFSAYCATRTAPPPAVEVVDLTAIASVALAGDFNAWSPSATPMEPTDDGRWSAVVSVAAPGPVEFKFVGNGDWALAVGDADQPDERFPVSGVAEPGVGVANIAAYLPRAGDYRFVLATPSLAYSVTAAPVDRPADGDAGETP